MRYNSFFCLPAVAVVLATCAATLTPSLAGEPEAPLIKDAAFHAANRGLSLESSLNRLKKESEIAGLIAQLRDAYKDRLAGLYIEHDPVFRIVMRLKSDQIESSRLFDAGTQKVMVEFIPNSKYTQAELRAALDKNLEKIKSAVPTLQGTYTDVKTGEVVLDVFGTEYETQRVQQAVGHLLDIPFRVRLIPAPLVQHAVRGSGLINGGTCTTTFVVKKTTGTTTGVLTAGHCANGNVSYTGLDSATASLTYQAQAYNASNDAQWYTTNATNEPKFYASATNLRTLTGRRTQASTAVGNNICHYGVASGYSCGDVFATDYQPTSYTCNGATCTATYIAVISPASGTGLACAGGDSGGPWFIGSVAAGIHSSGASSGPGIGQCLLAVYTSTDRISALGLQLMYGP
ncbi:MAG: hypothetical protein HOP03_06395 [Lysobacter sp.]|nr:hypothetical protein [Lysobacter sp.]